MSNYYNPNRKKYLYEPRGTAPFRLSRSKIDLFLQCPRCFYFDRRLGVPQPPSYPFSLNTAVDKLLKKEFDIHRANGTPHPLMQQYGIDAVPLAHEKINEWRDALRGGVAYHHGATNLLLTGGVDDIWINPKGELIVAEYKSTSKDQEVTLDADWQISYKRQMEFYQWLLRKNGFKVSDTGYFVYCNGNTDKQAFDGKLEFDIKIIPYKGDDSWVEKTVNAAYQCLMSDTLPPAGDDCDFCKYREAVTGAEKNSFSKKPQQLAL
ncbi:PD-(D/E)XK nuclease family protein [Candidatus Berkelbacteria bacterium]|nr:PD-(D/E)XK nuclease family protein [Candidatus Berkelbacteria bacterium]